MSAIEQSVEKTDSTAAMVEQVDPLAAAVFLRAQASWLRRGLQLADDPVEVRAVLDMHERTHASWVALVAAAEHTHGHETAGLVAQLYGFHGRIVGSLERKMDLRIDRGVTAQVRRLLAERLTALTEETVAALGA